MDGFYAQLLSSEPQAPTMIGVYATPRARKFNTLFVRKETPDYTNRPWELWWSDTHLVGYFEWSTIRQMLTETLTVGREKNPNLDVRVNNRITR